MRTLTTKEFIQSFEAIIKKILAFEKKLLDSNTKASDELKSKFDSLKKQFEKNSSIDILVLKKEANASVKKAVDSINAKMRSIKQPKDGKDGRDGIDGKTPTEQQLRKIIEPFIPYVANGKDGVDGKDGSPDTGMEIIDKINDDRTTLIKSDKVEGLSSIKDMVKTAEVNSRLPHYGVEKLSQLTDVSTTGVVNDSTIQYNSTTKSWKQGIAITVSATEPTSPNVNDLWVDIS